MCNTSNNDTYGKFGVYGIDSSCLNSIEEFRPFYQLLQYMFRYEKGYVFCLYPSKLKFQMEVLQNFGENRDEILPMLQYLIDSSIDNPQKNIEALFVGKNFTDTQPPVYSIRYDLIPTNFFCNNQIHKMDWNDLKKSLEPWLQSGNELIFIDPHFDSCEKRWKKPLEDIIQVAANRDIYTTENRTQSNGEENQQIPRLKIEYHCVYQKQNKWTIKYFCNRIQEGCKQLKLPTDILDGILIYIWDNTQRTRHDRYIITQDSMISFSRGLDSAQQCYSNIGFHDMRDKKKIMGELYNTKNDNELLAKISYSNGNWQQPDILTQDNI